MDRGAWQATIHRVAKSQTQLSNFHLLHLHSFISSVTPHPHPHLLIQLLCFLGICFFLEFQVQPRLAGSQETGVGLPH